LPQNDGTDFKSFSGFEPQDPGIDLTLTDDTGSAVAKLSLPFLPSLAVDIDLNFIVALSNELEMDLLIAFGDASDYLFFPIIPFKPRAKLFLVDIEFSCSSMSGSTRSNISLFLFFYSLF
jgi:hypothetical protein